MSEIQNVMVFGAGISGKGAAAELAEQGKTVFLYDDTPKVLEPELADALAANGGGFVSGNVEEVLAKVQQVVLSPAVPLALPVLQKAAADGIEVIAEIELAWRNFPGHMIAITGTNGKTTTTTLVGEMMKKLPVKTAVGGNIGFALSREVKGLDKNSWVTAEVSSYQLEGIRQFSPDVAAVLNLTPDHMERHKTMDEYARCKRNVFVNQTAKQVTILNYDDPEVRTWGKYCRGKICYFSRKAVLPEGVYMKDGSFFVKWNNKVSEICHKSELQIFGAHNEENVLAAIACGYFAGVTAENMRQTLLDFKGVEHRIEYVTTIHGVPYYNDSKATNTDSVIKALEAFPGGHIILLAGGHDKMTPLEPMMSLIREKTDLLILLGEAKERFYEAAVTAGVQNIVKVDTFKAAVDTAYAVAKPPQIVLLSPACSSFDMFHDMGERGRYFKKLVHELEK
ncbi:MAG: UDP-N-acetylmuramoyl-L-alanine--D-glutamate ligase [Succiniclasticum sp.]|uniref:UDP-N-acetylmuramoyl-L-alanine--D-glutamate ligase n=1 Tax=Succiniclasticum sp. TaxID=2775030 RepID=UPI002A91627C|nr:UDP-N-acetylmuramoyl-L-alanine--D-glutamate ligase [Succiniclasticum sp.]MDY6292069.1 UDP-N-acetylmuramoyl-L-alanine--D-glutamate ligase [Succiniclasticum sp.]